MVATALGAAPAPATSAAGRTDAATQARPVGTLDLTGVVTREVEPTATIPTRELRFVATMAVAGGRVWAASPDGLVAIDPTTDEVTVVSGDLGANITGGGNTIVRAVFGADHVEKWNATTGQLEWSAATEAPSGSAIVGDEIWVAGHHDGTLSVLRAADGALLDQVKVGNRSANGPATPIAVDGTVWVTDYRNHRFVAVDTSTRSVTARVQVPTAVQFCDQPPAVTATALWISDCSSLITRLDLATREATTIDAGTSVGSPVTVAGEVWVPMNGRFVHLRDDLTADRAVSVSGQPLVFGGVVAFGSLWANVGFGTVASLPSPSGW
jgi:outer membrane protein assembly factor BamB